jgi:hypothetical protein
VRMRIIAPVLVFLVASSHRVIRDRTRVLAILGKYERR